MLDCQSKDSRFKSRPGQKFRSRFLLCLRPYPTQLSTQTVHCQWEDEMVRERTGHPTSYAEAKKIKLLTLHTQSCHRAILMDCSSSSYSPPLPVPSPPPPLLLSLPLLLLLLLVFLVAFKNSLVIFFKT